MWGKGTNGIVPSAYFAGEYTPDTGLKLYGLLVQQVERTTHNGLTRVQVPRAYHVWECDESNSRYYPEKSATIWMSTLNTSWRRYLRSWLLGKQYCLLTITNITIMDYPTSQFN